MCGNLHTVHDFHFLDDPESRMLYEHHGENEMMTTFMNVNRLASLYILVHSSFFC